MDNLPPIPDHKEQLDELERRHVSKLHYDALFHARVVQADNIIRETIPGIMPKESRRTAFYIIAADVDFKQQQDDLAGGLPSSAWTSPFSITPGSNE